MSPRHALVASLSFIALCAAAPQAGALESFTLENVRAPMENGEGEIAIRRVEIVDTNLTRAEVEKVFTTATDVKERGEIAARMQAKRIAIPEIVVTRTGAEGGVLTINDYLVENLQEGRFSRFGVAGAAGKFTSKEGGEGTIASGPLLVQDADFSAFIAAAKRGDITEGLMKVGYASWKGFRVTVPDKDVPANAPGGSTHTIHMDSLESRTTYDGYTPLKTAATVSGIVFQPAPSSEPAQAMKRFGYDKVDLGITFAGDYNPTAKTFAMTDYTINGSEAGSLGFVGQFGNLGPGVFTAAKMERMNAMLEGTLNTLTLNYADKGLFEKALAYYAASTKKKPDAVRAEWSMMVTGMLPMLMGGDPAALKLAEALGNFVRSPKNLSITVKSKGPGVSFADMARFREPGDFLSKFDLTATANR